LHSANPDFVLFVQVNTEVMPPGEHDSEVEGKSKVTPHAILLDVQIRKLDVLIKRAGEVVNPLADAIAPKAAVKPNMESFAEEEEEEEEEDDEEAQVSSTTSNLFNTPMDASPAVAKHVQKQKKGRASLLSATVEATSGIEAFEVAENVQPAELIIICPLPTKDPLLEYRKMYDLMNALGGQKGVDIGGLKVSRKMKEQLLQHQNNYSWTDAIRGNIEVGKALFVCMPHYIVYTYSQRL
jgi:hypothetical protein